MYIWVYDDPDADLYFCFRRRDPHSFHDVQAGRERDCAGYDVPVSGISRTDHRDKVSFLFRKGGKIYAGIVPDLPDAALFCLGNCTFYYSVSMVPGSYVAGLGAVCFMLCNMFWGQCLDYVC